MSGTENDENFTGELHVGYYGGGLLDITNGGSVSNTDGYIGWAADSTGEVIVSGTDGGGNVSNWANTGTLTVGNDGTGTLTIADGGTVSAGDGAGGPGTVYLGNANIGTLNIGTAIGVAAAEAGTLDAAVVSFRDATGTLNFNHTGTTEFSAALESTGTGTHALNHLAGTTTLTGVSSAFTGTTTVSGGTLAVANALDGSASVVGGAFIVDGTFGGPVEAHAGGTVSGAGTIEGNADLTGGGVLEGASGQTLRIEGIVVMDATSVVNVTLGGPSATALFDLGGSLVLDGTLNVSDAGGFGAGVYRIFDYENALIDNDLVIGSTPHGIGADDLSVQVAVAKQVNLISTTGAELSFWDGGDAALHDNGAVDGGAGVWRADGRNWTQADGALNGPFQPIPTYAVFQRAGGLVTVDATAGGLGVTGMQFDVDGYRIEGDAMALEGGGGQSIVRVGDGTAGGAGMAAAIASVLTGSSSLVKSDHGTLVLSGANTFDGGVRIDAGVLSVSSDANLGAVTGALTFNGGTLATTADFDSDRLMTLDTTGRLNVATGTVLGLTGSVTGTGDLIKLGGGTLILFGLNTYGNTLVEEGTLTGNAGSISGHIGNAATVVFDQGANASFAGTIGGLGGVGGDMIKRGVGTLTLTGMSALDWTVEAGGLVSASDRFGGDVAIAGGASFAFDQPGSDSYAGVLSGAGSFIKSGSGTVLLTGDSSAFAGTTTVDGGALIVGRDGNGALGGALTIQSGGVLGGTGDVGSAGSTVTIAAGAVHAPGNSIGVQRIVGNYANHGTLHIQATPAEADRIIATGSVDITGATLDLALSPSVAASWGVFNGPFTIIDNQSASDVVGSFDPVTQNLLFLDALVAYDGGDGNDVTLELQRNDLAFAGVGRTPNQIASGTAIDTLDRTHALWRSIALTNDPDTVRASFDALSGEMHASARTGLVEDSRFVRNAANDRMRAAFATPGASWTPVLAYGPGATPVLVSPDHSGPAFWAHGFGSWGSTDGNGNAASLGRSTGGLLIGADGMSGDWRIGLLAGYSQSRFDVKDRSSSGMSDNYHLGLYGGTQWGDLAIRTGAAYTWRDIETTRTVAIPGFVETLTAGYRAGTVQAFGELAYGFDMGATRFEPFANLAHVHVHTGGFTETGGAAALSGAGGGTDMTFATLGLRVEHGLSLGGIDATFRGMLGWRHTFGDTIPTSTHTYTVGDAFTIAGAPIARDSAVIEAGLDLKLTPEATLGLSYTGQLGSGTQDHGFKANLSVRF